jgi:hypothetical protein
MERGKDTVKLVKMILDLPLGRGNLEKIVILARKVKHMSREQRIDFYATIIVTALYLIFLTQIYWLFKIIAALLIFGIVWNYIKYW